MSKKKISVAGIGCHLIDRILNPVDFNSEVFKNYKSMKPGDGGIVPGHLVFADDLVKFRGKSLNEIINEITSEKTTEEISIGGPGIVSFIHAAQMSCHLKSEYSFYGFKPVDDMGAKLSELVKKVPVKYFEIAESSKNTPRTEVLVDPIYNDGSGERVFINEIGAAWDIIPEKISDEFYEADITIFGGTALVPNIHDKLDDLLKKAKSKGCITIVNTVFDFRNEQLNPDTKWPIGKSDETYKFIDLLITDHAEALRLSGTSEIEDALAFFKTKHVKSLMITNGVKPLILYSKGGIFKDSESLKMPVSEYVLNDKNSAKTGDTTGCGDNFVGGVIYSIVDQIVQGTDKPDIFEAACWGIVSGGFATYYNGGTYYEKEKGEKFKMIEKLYQLYKKQINE